MPPLNDLIGKRFGRLTAICLTKRKNGRVTWKCKCDCGNEVDVIRTSLICGSTRSCGCYNKEILKISKNNIKPEGEASRNCLYSNYRAAARRRNLPFELSREEFSLLTKQECHYCGNSPSQIISQVGLNGAYVYNGIDRVDSSKGYVAENCVPCCGTCNRAKLSMSQIEFFRWVDKVYRHIHFIPAYTMGDQL